MKSQHNPPACAQFDRLKIPKSQSTSCPPSPRGSVVVRDSSRPLPKISLFTPRSGPLPSSPLHYPVSPLYTPAKIHTENRGQGQGDANQEATYKPRKQVIMEEDEVLRQFTGTIQPTVEILHPPSPLQIKSTTLIAPECKNAPSYLQLYREEQQACIETMNSLSSVNISNNTNADADTGADMDDDAGSDCPAIDSRDSLQKLKFLNFLRNLQTNGLPETTSEQLNDHQLREIYAETLQCLQKKNERMEVEENVLPKLNVSPNGCAIEIQPSPVPLSVEELKETISSSSTYCDDEESSPFPAKSAIILQAGKGRTMKDSYTLSNNTSFLHGFKVLVSSVARDCVNISPSIGLIQPHSQVSIIISAPVDLTNEELRKSNCNIEFKMFRYYCEEPSKVKEYFQMLEEQHPELIQTRAINNLIVWNPEDLPAMMNAMNSISDLREREDLKEEVYVNLPETEAIAHSKTSMQDVREMKMFTEFSNQRLKDLYYELNFIRNMLIGMFGIIILLVVCICAYNLSDTEHTADDPVETPYETQEPEYEQVSTSNWTKFLNYLADQLAS